MAQYIVLSAPSGAGKTTIAKQLVERNADFRISVSATTRIRRPREIDAVDYHFLEPDDFAKKIDHNDFIEYEEVHGDYYGTIRSTVESHVAAGLSVIFDIDVKGALSIKKEYPQALLIFIKAPSLSELRSRLKRRRSEDRQAIERRLKRIDYEYSQAEKFDFTVINKDLKKTVNQIENIIRKNEIGHHEFKK
jgi:guanylate kinase